MTKFNLNDRILATSSDVYLYGEIIYEKGDITNLKVIKTNYNEISTNNRMIDEIEFPESKQIDWKEHLGQMMRLDTYRIENIEINKISEHEIVVWIKNDNKQKTEEMKRELNEQKRLLELFIDAIPEIVFYKNVEGIYVMCNKALAQMTKADKKNIIGKKDKEINILNMQAHKCQDFDRSVIEFKKEMTVEEKVFLDTGEVRLMESLKVPFLDDKNQLLGIIGICRDITEKRTAENKLKESEERLNQIYKNIQDIIAIIEDNKITYVNPAYEKIYGESCLQLCQEGSLESILQKIKVDGDKEVTNNEENIDIRGSFINKDGEEKWLHIKCYDMEEMEYCKERKILFMSDISDQVEKDREVERLKNEFFANISHEFKTPINLISSALQVLKFNLEQLEIDESLYKKYFKISDQNILRLLKLINDLIDSTKISSDYVEFMPQNHDIVNFVEDIIMSLVEYCNQNKMEVIFDTEFEEKVIYFDLTKVEQIILNLISNAIKYSDGDCIWVTISQVGQMVQISVKDNGRGIPKDKLTYIFNRFTQLDDQFKKSNEGSGIGLYLVKAFAQMHGGKVDVESVWGEGSEFRVGIPDRQGVDTHYQTKQRNDNSHIDRIKVEFSDIYK